MNLKTSALGLLIYGALALYAAAFLAGGAAHRARGRRLFGAGFLFALAAVILRAVSTGHIPLQNLFEVFLAMGALMPVFSRLWRRTAEESERADALLGLLLLFPAGFVFPEIPRPLPPALQSPLFAPHVLTYLAAYVLLAKAAMQAVARLRESRPERQEALDLSGYRLAAWGYPFLTLGLLLGAWWGKLAWGDFWHWDPKEMWALATWLIYTGYFHARATMERTPSRVYAGLLLVGFAAILLTLTWVNLSRMFPGLHSYAM
jgi:ABC-type transport system involved in cytochrome c biogenesis permease subunit